MKREKHYRVAGVTFAFDYAYDDFFKDNIEAYEITPGDTVDHTLKTELKDTIKCPDLPLIKHNNVKHLYRDHHHEIVCFFDKNGVLIETISYTLDYKTITMTLKNDSSRNLAEREYILSGMVFMELALRNQRLPFHATAIQFGDEAFLISASAGTGKSTHRNYWQETIDGVSIINDDKPILYVQDHKVCVSGSPWSGKDKLNKNTSVPVKAIVFLERGQTNALKHANPNEILTELIKHCYRPNDNILKSYLLEMVDYLIKHIPFYTYYAEHDPSSATVLHKKLFKEANDED